MLKRVKNAIESFPGRNALYIQDQYYTYSALGQRISDIRHAIESSQISGFKHIGLMAEDDFDTYASLFAILFSGCGYVPVNPSSPAERNLSIIAQSEAKIVIASHENELLNPLRERGVNVILTANIKSSEINLDLPKVGQDETAYIIFTSGSTGVPKGVPITRANISAFIDAFFTVFDQMDEHDGYLQMFDLTFDASVMHYLPALCTGACAYTVPRDEIKYLYAYKLLSTHPITFSLMMPSTLSYLRPYFDKIRLENLKYSLFGGEAVYQKIIEEWADCVPNALIYNAYGPTEASIFFMIYSWDRSSSAAKAFNGLVPIGGPMKNSTVIVVDENFNEVIKGEPGELCVAGPQVTPGYINNPERNSQAFFLKKINGTEHRFYRTGDLAYIDKDGDFMFCGRVDNQVQIQGFRVELGEIEHHAMVHSRLANVAAVPLQNDIGNTQIYLFLENYTGEITGLQNYLKEKLPSYMIPAGIRNVEKFPLSVNGKIDRKILAGMIKKK